MKKKRENNMSCSLSLLPVDIKIYTAIGAGILS